MGILRHIRERYGAYPTAWDQRLVLTLHSAAEVLCTLLFAAVLLLAIGTVFFFIGTALHNIVPGG